MADIGDEITAHLLGLAQMGDVGEMQQQRKARAVRPRARRGLGQAAQCRDTDAELGTPGTVSQLESRLAGVAVRLHRLDPAQKRGLAQHGGIAAALDPVAQEAPRRGVRRDDQTGCIEMQHRFGNRLNHGIELIADHPGHLRFVTPS